MTADAQALLHQGTEEAVAQAPVRQRRQGTAGEAAQAGGGMEMGRGGVAQVGERITLEAIGTALEQDDLWSSLVDVLLDELP